MGKPKYGEPWGHNPASNDHAAYIHDKDGRWVLDNDCEDENERICACVNALAGVAKPAKIPALLEACKEWYGGSVDSSDDAAHQHYHLRDAIKAVMEGGEDAMV